MTVANKGLEKAPQDRQLNVQSEGHKGNPTFGVPGRGNPRFQVGLESGMCRCFSHAIGQGICASVFVFVCTCDKEWDLNTPSFS